jgi:hypothetical protein
METTRTGPGGRFDVYIPLDLGVHQLTAAFGGDESYEASASAPRPFDVAKDSVVLTVTAADLASTDAQTTATVTSSTTGGPASLRVEVLAGDPKGELRSIASITTGQDGTGTANIPRTLLGDPGTKRIVARFAGNASFNPADAEDRFQLTSSTKLVGVAGPQGQVKYESTIRITGKLVADEKSEPVANVLVQVGAGSKKLADALTHKDGSFTLSFSASDLAPGAATIAVAYDSRVPWRRGTRSDPLTFTVLEPRPVPIIYTILAFLATAMAVGALVLWRTKPWRKLLLRWRRRRAPVDATNEPARPDEPAIVAAAGLKLARPSLMSTLRRPGDHGFTGRVRDAMKGDPIADARVALLHPVHPEIRIGVDRLGQFSVERVPAGDWQVEVGSPGYVTEKFSISLPHRGELRGVRVDLLPVRERVFALYKDVAAGLLPSPNLWGVWTPREIFDHVRARRPSGRLGELTTFVEEVYFSARTPGEEILPTAQASVRAARAEQSAL